MAGIVNKVKDVFSGGDNTTSTTSGTHPTTTSHASGNAGPHQSAAANKLDPRVDSDLDGSRNAGATTHGTTGTTHTGSGHVGPHDSGIANKLDPRVDSDLDTSRNAGAATHGTTSTTGTTGTTGTTHSTTGTTHPGSGHVGPHDSGVANKLDPRVDSDLDASRNAGAASHTTTGPSHTSSGNAGPHKSSLLNKLDPRVDSDRDGSRNAGAATHHAGGTGAGYGSSGTGTTTGTATGGPTTAGPHKSDLANKADPRVDSDLDGSRTVGATRTQNEPLDAAKHRPSQFHGERGDPSIEHGNPQHKLAGRHGDRRGSADHYGSGVM